MRYLTLLVLLVLSIVAVLVVDGADIDSGERVGTSPQTLSEEATTTSFLPTPVVTTTSAPAPVTTTVPRARTAPIERPARSVGDSEGVRRIVREVFGRFGPVVADEAVRVASCETGGTFDPNATNGQHLGLFQISRAYHADRVQRMGYLWAQLADPEVNALVAADIYAESGWGPWTCRRALSGKAAS